MLSVGPIETIFHTEISDSRLRYYACCAGFRYTLRSTRRRACHRHHGEESEEQEQGDISGR